MIKPRRNPWSWQGTPGIFAPKEPPPEEKQVSDTPPEMVDNPMTKGFTATEQRILRILADGGRHTKKELLTALGDPMAVTSTFRVHLFNLRRKLRLLGEDVVTGLAGMKIYYQHVLLKKSNPYGE